jgi:hypothetical protein
MKNKQFLVNSLKQMHTRQYLETVKYETGYNEAEMVRNGRPQWLVCLYHAVAVPLNYLKDLKGVLTCAVRGHHWQTGGWVDAEAGAYSIWCDVCSTEELGFMK